MIKEVKGKINQDTKNKEQIDLEKNQTEFTEVKNLHNKCIYFEIMYIL